MSLFIQELETFLAGAALVAAIIAYASAGVVVGTAVAGGAAVAALAPLLPALAMGPVAWIAVGVIVLVTLAIMVMQALGGSSPKNQGMSASKGDVGPVAPSAASAPSSWLSQRQNVITLVSGIGLAAFGINTVSTPAPYYPLAPTPVVGQRFQKFQNYLGQDSPKGTNLPSDPSNYTFVLPANTPDNSNKAGVDQAIVLTDVQDPNVPGQMNDVAEVWTLDSKGNRVSPYEPNVYTPMYSNQGGTLKVNPALQVVLHNEKGLTAVALSGTQKPVDRMAAMSIATGLSHPATPRASGQ